VTADLGATGPAALVAALATRLPPRFAVTVVAFATGPSTAVAALADAGVPVRVVRVRSRFDVRGLRGLRGELTARRPAVLHLIGPAAARLAPLVTTRGVGLWPRPRVVVTADPDPVPLEDTPPVDPARFRAAVNVPHDARLIIAGGRFDSAADLRAAVWAFEVLKYPTPNLYLVLAGDGPGRGGVEAFARRLGFDDFRTRFAGPRSDLPALFALAEAAWVTHAAGGGQTAVEAMNAGVPLMGFATPKLKAVVGDAGVLVPPGDHVALAAATAAVLADPARAASLATAGRERAGQFAAAGVAARFAAVYDDGLTLP